MLDSERFESLANHWSGDGCAISFYYSPSAPPQNLAHKNTVLSAKERLRELSRSQECRPAMKRVFARIEERLNLLTLEPPRGLAILAAAEPEVWFEMELPYAVKPMAEAGNHFMIAPLLPLLGRARRTFVLLLDRAVTRLIMVSHEDFVEKTKEFGEPRQVVRETGTGRKVSDERSKDDDSFHHLREVGTRLLKWMEHGAEDTVYFGCRDELWREIQEAMPEGVMQKTIGHFQCDPALATLKEVREIVQPLMDERVARELQQFANNVRGQAEGGRKGVVGPERVAKALEQGETQVILIAPHEPVPAGVCSACEHVEVGTVESCSLCEGDVRMFADLEEVIARRGGGAVKVMRVPRGMIPDKARGFVAALRFRAERRGTESSSQAA